MNKEELQEKVEVTERLGRTDQRWWSYIIAHKRGAV